MSFHYYPQSSHSDQYCSDAVQYDLNRLATLAKQATSSDSPFSLTDKIGIVRDAFMLAEAGYASVRGALDAMDALSVDEQCT